MEPRRLDPPAEEGEMLGRFRNKLNYVNVIFVVAVFAVLATGGAFAAQKIGPNDIAKNAVRSKHIKKNAVGAKHIATNAVRSRHIQERGVRPGDLAVLPHSLVRANSVQTFPNNAVTKIAFELPLATSNFGIEFNDAEDSLEISYPGIYLITASIQWANNANGSRSLQIRVNNSIKGGDGRLPTSTLTNQSVSAPLALGAGDVITAFAIQSSGGDLNTATSNLEFAKLSAVWLSPLDP